LQNGKTLLDQVSVYQIQIQACIAQNQALAAIQIALPLLKRLGVTLPAKPTKLHTLRGLLETKWALAGKPVEDLIHLPPMTGAVPLAAMQILSSIGTAAYLVKQELFPIVIFKQILITIKYGNTPISAVAYSAYGVVLCGALGDIALGYRFGNLAMNGLSHFSANVLKAKVVFIVETFIRHWKAPFHQRLQPLLEAYQSGVETGDFEYAAYAASSYCNFLFYSGRELSEVCREIGKYTGTMAQNKQDQVLSLQKMLEQMVLNLSGFCDDPCRLCGSSYNEDTTPITANNSMELLTISFFKLILGYLFGQYHKALAACRT
jgi:predicted ATPase